jgi:hypothetical protein
MAVGLMMLPAIAARHWAREVSGMAYAAVGIALATSFVGILVSYHLDVPTGPAFVLVAGAAWGWRDAGWTPAKGRRGKRALTASIWKPCSRCIPTSPK